MLLDKLQKKLHNCTNMICTIRNTSQALIYYVNYICKKSIQAYYKNN